MSSYGYVCITSENDLKKSWAQKQTSLGSTLLHMVESPTGAYLAFHDGTYWRRVESSIIEFESETTDEPS